MSFAKYKQFVEDGDTVILYLGFNNMHTIIAESGNTFQTRYGALRHSELIGKPYGSKIVCSKGYLYVLYPTPELWTKNLPHRTQILYSTDISVVTMQLDLKPGSIVVECGTGSGSLSHAIIRTIAPTGHLFTFEFHEQRSQVAQEEFKQHGIADIVTVTHRDVCQDGFQLDDIADAVFLDLPSPWNAITSAKQALKREGGRLCSFSPCIEQVQRTCETLSQEGFEEVTSHECLVRSFDVRTINLPLAYLGPPGQSNAQAGVEHSEDNCEMETGSEHSEGVKVEGEVTTNLESKSDDEPDNLKPSKCLPPAENSSINRDVGLIGKRDNVNFTFKTGAPPSQMPGHTGFLTFATLFPS